jgi:Family of unknown function (DUF6361)
MSRAQIFWLTFSHSDIATAKQFMDSLKGDNTVDVLGLTRTMEGISDILFPATSTLHKRIRYQIFVPAIIQAMYRNNSRIKPEYELERLEYLLQRTLIDSGEQYNVFGSSRGEALKYWPSTIYWASLNKLQLWGEENLGRGEALELIEERNRPNVPKDDGDTESVAREIQPTSGLDELYKNIFSNGRIAKRLTFALERAEASFFEKRFVSLFPDSITSYILKYGNRNWCRRPLFDLKCPKNPKLNYLLRQACAYSHIAMGAYYGYRWALCRALRQAGRLSRDEEKANAQHFERWLGNNLRDVNGWQYVDLIKALAALGGSVPEKGESEFVEDFLRCVSQVGSLNRKLLALDQIVRKREENVKGNRSHFNNPDVQAPKNTLGGEQYRDFYFDYRWQQGKTNLEDIFDGLKR